MEEILKYFSLICTLVAGLSLPNVALAETLPLSQIIGVWTTSDDGIDHGYSPDRVASGCQAFKFIIHPDLKVESVLFDASGWVLAQAVSDEPCLYRDNALACTMTTRSKNRVLSQSTPVAWHFEAVDAIKMDSRIIYGRGSDDTMYRCTDTIEEASIRKPKQTI